MEQYIFPIEPQMKKSWCEALVLYIATSLRWSNFWLSLQDSWLRLVTCRILRNSLNIHIFCAA